MKRVLGVSVALVPILVLGAALALLLRDLRPFAAMRSVATWYDPLYLTYNLLLLAFAVIFIPFMAASYLVCMKDEKAVRMKRELGALWPAHEERVMRYIESQFRPRDYVTGVAAMMIVVAFGGVILLIMKPVWHNVGLPSPGLDFAHGANLLLLGSNLEEYTDQKYHVLAHSLTAFAFGFLGAYIYSLTQLVRGYFTTDLNAGSFVAATTRMIVASTAALLAASVATAMISEPALKAVSASVGGVSFGHDAAMTLLPLISFFFGYFPHRAMRVIERVTAQALTWMVKEESWGETGLNKISGMNINHVFRLEREGFDNAENLACADPIELAMRTGFPYPQVKSWIDEARLMIHLGDDFRAFVAGTGIRTYDQLCTFVKRWDSARGSWSAQLAKASGNEALATKLEAIVQIADVVEPPAAAVVPPPPFLMPIRGDSSTAAAAQPTGSVVAAGINPT